MWLNTVTKYQCWWHRTWTYQLQIRSSARPDTQWQVVECCIVDDQFSPVGQETGSRKILLSRQSSTNDHLQISPPVLSNSLVSVKNISGRGHTLICILTTKHNNWRKEVKENFEKTEEFLNKGVYFLYWVLCTNMGMGSSAV